MAKGMFGLVRWVVDGAVDIWEAFPVISSLVGACAAMVCSRCLVMLMEYMVLLNGWRPMQPGNHLNIGLYEVPIAAFTAVVTGYMACNLTRLSSLPTTHRRWWARFCAHSYFVFMTLNVAANFLETRTSHEALFNAFWFSFFGATMCLPRTCLRLAFNAIACFSWHMIRRNAGRSSSLQHIATALAIFCSSLVASHYFQQHLDAVQSRVVLSGEGAFRSRQRLTRRSLENLARKRLD